MKLIYGFFFVWSLLGVASVSAQNQRGQLLNSSEALSAKTILEDMIVRRYSRELATRVDDDQFNLGARLEVVKVAPEKKDDKKKTEPQVLTDLDLGYLDPDKLFENYSESKSPEISSFLSQYAIKSVEVSVGLKERLTDETKKQVENWLQARVQSEFGKLGKSEVHSIQLAPPEAEDTSFWKQLKELQELAGQIVLALALLAAVLLWALFNRAQDTNLSTDVSINNENAAEGQKKETGFIDSPEREASLLEQLAGLTQQVREIAPKVGGELGSVVREWCSAGQQGIFQVACFAEAANTAVGKLPIPADLQNDVYREFAKMPDAAIEDKLSALRKAYWDLVAVLNLGVQALHRPFSFVGGAPVNTVSQVLMEESVEMSTVVSLFMPRETRQAFWKSLDFDKKKAMLSEAAHLSEISASDLEAMEARIEPHFGDQQTEGKISLDMTLGKLVESMSVTEQCRLLKEISGPSIESFKRSRALLAFTHEWPDDAFGRFLERVGNDEILGYLSVYRDLELRVLNLVPPKTRQVLQDDLGRINELSEADVESYLATLQSQVERMVVSKEVDLAQLFGEAVVQLRDVEDATAA